MKENYKGATIITQFSESFLPAPDQVLFRIELGETPIIRDVSFVKSRVVEDVELADEMHPALEQLAELKNAEVSEKFDAEKKMPKLLVLSAHENGMRQRFEYDNLEAFSISKHDLGKPNSFYHPRMVILPDAITDKAKSDFCSGKDVRSEWALSGFRKESKQVSMSRLRWDHWLRKFKKLTGEKWLLQKIERSNFSELENKSGLKLSIYNDDTFYDEAINKALDIEWINNDGELNNFHWVSHGKVNFFEGSQYLVPTEHSNIGTPESSEIKYVRYNDYDTKVVDTIEIYGRCLYRCVSVLTNGIYLDRYMYAYEEVEA